MAWLETVMRDTRYSLRRLMRDWRFSLAAVLILAIGIGANTAVFSVINAVLFRQVPFSDPDRLVDIYQNGNNAGVDANSYPAYLDMAAYTDVFAGTMAAMVPLGVTYQDDGAVRPGVAEYTTATCLSVLGLQPSLGRWFTTAEDTRGAAAVAVLGHEAWTKKFQADPSVVGRTIRIEGVPVTIVGVGPAGYNATINIGLVTDFWLPIASLPVMGAPARVLERRPEEAAFLVKARLKDGITVAQAQAAMRVLGARLASEYPNEDPGRGITVFASRDVRVHPQLDTAVRWTAIVVLAVVGLVLAIACSNLATLLLVRGASRAKELSMRLALGATRRQIVRHLLIESLLLSAVGGIAGSIVAWWAVSSLGAVDLPIVLDLRLEYRVFAFAIALALLTGIAFGLAPALKASRIDLVPALRDQGETRSGDRWFSLKNAFIVFQVMVSVVLLGGTSMFLQLLSVSRAHRGNFAVDSVAIVETDPRYSSHSGPDAANLFDELVRRTAAIPGVEAAALSRDMPLTRTGTRVVVDGKAGASEGTMRASMIWAGPRYFDVLQVPVLYGRAIDERDRPDTPRVAVLSESMAIRVFHTANAVGRRFHLELDPNTWFDVVGVVRDTGSSGPQTDFDDHSVQVFYRSFAQERLSPSVVLARTALDAGSLLGSMQRELRIVDATLPVTSAKTMAQYLEESLATPKAVAVFLAVLGGVGLALATIGLYAIVAFAVSRRAREIGIRMALGARSQQVVWQVAREVAVLVSAGTGAGLILCLLTILAMRSVVAPAPGISLYRPSADPMALAAIVAIMAIVGLAAASLPAWRAVKMDPLTALRRD